MKKISSGRLYMLKKVFPVFWFGFLAVFIAMAFGVPLRDADPGRWIFFVLPCVMAVAGAFIFRKLISDLADEVHDGGTFLVVRRGSEEETIQLENIMNVSVSMFINPPRVTLKLVKPGIFGDEIAFSPIKTFSFNAFAKNPIAEDLIVRVDAARRAGARR